MDAQQFGTTAVVFAGIFIVIGALVLAFIHGLGYVLTGLRKHKSRFRSRFLIQLLAGFIIWGFVYIIPDEWFLDYLFSIYGTAGRSVADGDHAGGAWITYMGIMIPWIILYYLAIAVQEFFLFEPRGNLKAAFIPALVPAGLIFVSYTFGVYQIIQQAAGL